MSTPAPAPMTLCETRKPPKGLVLKCGLFWAPPTPNPPPGKATHELLDREPQLDLAEWNG